MVLHATRLAKQTMMMTTYLKQDHSVHTCDHISQQLNSLADTPQKHQVYTNEVEASLFTSDTSTPCEFNIAPDSTEIEFEKPIEETTQNDMAFISIVNINIEILLEMHIYSITTLTVVMHSLTKINTQFITTRIAKPLLVFT